MAAGAPALLAALVLGLALAACAATPAPPPPSPPGAAGTAAAGGDAPASSEGSGLPRPSRTDLAARVNAYTAGFGAGSDYRVPGAAQRRAVADGVALAVEGRAERAVAELAKAGYRMTELTDTATDRRLVEIADAAEETEAKRGWGRVYVDLSARPSWSVQVPHPVADSRTEALGVDVFRGAPGGVLVVAGAHRRADEDGASDPAHRTDTVFSAVLEALAAHGLPGIQVHGFDEGSLPGQDAVVSTGTAAPGPAAERVAERLGAAGWTVCRAWQEKCGRLEGATNVGGRFAAGLGVPWLHVELANRLRTEPDQRARVAAALAATARSWPARPAG
ncbi:hypothetical protein ACWEQL_08500 [Kitasatospora sp. NPDC004240]